MTWTRAIDVARTLLSRYRFAGVATMIDLVEAPAEAQDRIRRLAVAGGHLLDLDAEDFDVVGGDGVLPEQIASQVRSAQFPRLGGGAERGSLTSLVPLYELMLEALDVRWLRREPMHVVVLLHLMAEYLPMLAWESTLGHAGDPRRLVEFVSAPGSLWGRNDRDCDHNTNQRSAAERVAGVLNADAIGWTSYLDRYHSRVSDALGKCGTHPLRGRPKVAGVCRTPCALWTQLAPESRTDLNARVHLARMYAVSPAVELRHHAPVGHFFGVPAPVEIEDAWERTWARLHRAWRTGDNPLRVRLPRRRPGGSREASRTLSGEPDTEALPGLSAVISAVAGRSVRAGGVLTGIRDVIDDELSAAARAASPARVAGRGAEPDYGH